MSKRSVSSANYYSCARCGYRGISEEHECAADRLVAQDVGGRLSPGTGADRVVGIVTAAPRSPDEPAEVMLGTFEQFNDFGPHQGTKLSIEIGNMLGRYVGVVCTSIASKTYTIVMRCPACAAELTKPAPGERTYLATLASVGAAARKMYLVHRCEPIDQPLLGLTYDELADLHERLEREAVRLMERCAQIDAIRRRR